MDSCIVIVADTLRADHLTTYGYDRPTSPELERWARQGVVFEHAFSTTSWTLPAFGSLFTGHLPSTHEVGLRTGPKSRSRLVDSLPTLAEQVEAAGIPTAALLSNPYLHAATSGIDRGFALYENEITWDPEAPDRRLRYRDAGAAVDRALEWIEAQDGRFLLVLHLFDPHFPLDPPADLVAELAAGVSPEIARGLRREERLEELQADPSRREELEQGLIHLYDAEIAYVDREVGRLLATLERSGRLDTSLVLFTSDHGEELYDRGQYEHGHTFYNEIVRVPLIAWHPQASAGRREGLASWLDIAPTVLEALGLDPSPDLPGVSLLDSIRGAVLPKRTLAAEGTTEVNADLAVFDERYKLTITADGPRLFDWRNDARESRELLELGERPPPALLSLAGRSRRANPQGEGVPIPDEIAELLRALGYVE